MRQPKLLNYTAILIAALSVAGAHTSIFANEYPSHTLSVSIVDDGINSIYYLGQEDEGIPPTPSIPLYVVSNNEPMLVDVPFASLSSIVRYQGPSKLTFYRSPPSPDPDAPLPPIAGTVQLPQTSSETVLLFFTEDFATRKYRILALNDSLASFPENSLRIFNFSSNTVAVELDGQHKSLSSNASHIVPLDISNSYQRLKIARYDDNASRWRLALNRSIRVRDGTRSTYLIFNRPGQGDGRIMIRRINDPVQLRQENFRYYNDDNGEDDDRPQR